MTDRDVHLLSGAYVLHAVTAEEALAVEAAMAESEELRHEVVGLADTAVALGLAVPEAAPPAGLRGSLLAAIETTRQVPAQARALEPRPAEQHLAPRRRPRRRRPALVLAAAAVAVLIFGGGVVVQRALIEPQLRYSQVHEADDARQAQATVAGGGTISVVWSAEQHGTTVDLKGVRTPSGRVLQLWIVRGGTITSAGLYRPVSDTQGDLLDRLPSPGEKLAVSVEPAGGSRQPTTTPIVDLALS